MSDPKEKPDEAADPGRRSFLAAATLGVSGATAAAVAIPAAVVIHDPIGKTTVSAALDLAPVGKVADFEVAKPALVEIKAAKKDAWANLGVVTVGRAWVIKNDDGDFTVFSAVCPHLGCAVDWKTDRTRFECPCHTSYFEAGGASKEGPSPRGLDRLEHSIDGDTLLVKFQRFELNIADQKPVA